MTNTSGRFCLVRDNDSHWYVIPAHRNDEWERWCEDENWDVPPFATPIDNPYLLTFENFRT